MSRRIHTIALTIGLSALIGVTAGAQLGSILKAGGIGFIVSKFGRDIDKAINSATKTPNDDPVYATKVVPVISVGDGKEAGAVQITGPRSAVDKVKAVAQFETNFRPLNTRLRGLIPIDSKSVGNLHRVPGVGISGLIDVKI